MLVGPALILTTVVLACGLVVTVFSDLPSLRLFGWLSAFAMVAALVSAAVIGMVSLRAGQHEDTTIGALWAVVNLVRRHREPYAYGPGIVLGPYVVLLIAVLTQR